MRFSVTLVAGFLLATSPWADSTADSTQSDSNILARIDDRNITFAQLNTQLNSTAVVGLSTPALGTPERRTVILTLLDKAISVNLLYLDAVDKGKLEDPTFKLELREYTNGMLAGRYRRHYLKADTVVSDAEIADYVKQHFAKQTKLDEKVRPLIEAKVKKAKYAASKQGLRKHLHEGMNVRIHTRHLEIEDDSMRNDDRVIAEYDGIAMTWGESKKHLTTLNNSIDLAKRLDTLNALIDNYLLAKKGRASGLEQDPGFQSALAEYTVTRLVNQHRRELVKGMQPTEQEIKDYFVKNQRRITFNEHRKLQMLVLKEKSTALDIMGKIEKGELTFYQAVMDHSIDPRAKQTLGDFGWVEEGSGFRTLDELTFALDVGELGGPVETPAGWHIIRVTDQRASKYTDIEDLDTRQQTRRLLLKERLNSYVTDLRKRDFTVVVYEENLNRMLKEEAQWIAAKRREMERNPQRAQLVLEEMKALVE
jgi:parvulin-like peptidyl-prolyl isomerase